MDSPRPDTRAAALAGTWYPDNPDRLRQSIALVMERAGVPVLPEKILGLVAPHAGHMYSGPVAAHAYRQIQGRHYDTVIIIAPNHVDPRLGFSSVLTRGAYETPLGTVPVDGETAEAIVRFDHSGGIRSSGEGHLSEYGGRMEHSIEIHLPFLQYALDTFPLVPVVMGNQDRAAAERLAGAVSAAISGRNALVIASSDLSHFYSSAEAGERDARVRRYIERFDPEGLLADDDAGESHVCGRGPIAVTMMVCRAMGASAATVLRMGNSGDVTGDSRSVVGYLSAAFSYPGTRDVAAEERGGPDVGVCLGLDDAEKEILREVVRETLREAVRSRRTPEFGGGSGRLGEKRGAFVTLTRQGSLRGCIGNIIGTKPLIETVAEMTRAAALEDPRFPPVSAEELPGIEFEISVLTPVRRIGAPDEIVVGRDGIIITRGYHRGLLLPQVAVEYGWNRETFLEQTCRKAGLPRDAWKEPDTIIETFSAEVFR